MLSQNTPIATTPMGTKWGRVLRLIGPYAVRLDFVSGLWICKHLFCECFALFRENSISRLLRLHFAGGPRLPLFVSLASLRDCA